MSHTHTHTQVEEHHAVRNSVGIFDVSHMVVSDIAGEETEKFLSYILANDITKLNGYNRAMYSCMLNEQGGVIDDLIVYRLSQNKARVVTNAATKQKDLAWLNQQAKKFAVSVAEHPELAILALQGPKAIEIFCQLINQAEELKKLERFAVMHGDLVNELADGDQSIFIARTGYTGEDGLEIILPEVLAPKLWQRVVDLGAQPIGLGARDTLRLEAGMLLYGSDMDETTTPLESGIGWTVVWQDASGQKREFIGKTALEQQKNQGLTMRLVGIKLLERGMLRPQQKVIFSNGESGITTSGSFSPTLGKAIALARVPSSSADITNKCQVEIRNKLYAAEIVKLPFI